MSRCPCGKRYDFEAYSDASDKMYGVFLRFAPVVMAVSCDEAFLELGQGKDPVAAAAQVRWSSFGYDFSDGDFAPITRPENPLTKTLYLIRRAPKLELARFRYFKINSHQAVDSITPSLVKERKGKKHAVQYSTVLSFKFCTLRGGEDIAGPHNFRRLSARSDTR